MALSISGFWAANGNNSTSSIATANHTPPSGDLIVAGIATHGTCTQVTDNNGRIMTLLPVYGPSASSNFIYIAYITNAALVNGPLTATMSAPVSCSITGVAITGAAANFPFDKSASDIGTGTAQDSGNAPTTQFANEVLVGVGGNGTGSAVTWTQGGGYTLQGNYSGAGAGLSLALETQIVSGTGAYNSTLTSSVSSNWLQVIVTFSDTNISGNTASLAWVL